jgi:hypothetical protein
MTSINPLKEMHYFSIAVLSTAMEITIPSVFFAARANLPEADKAGGESTKIKLSLNLGFGYGV